MKLQAKTALQVSEIRSAVTTGAALGVATMAGFLAQPTFELVNTYAAHKVLRSIAAADALQGQLLIELTRFAFTLLAVHIALGICSALAAIATLTGFRKSKSPSPAQWTILWHFAFLVWVVGASSTWYPMSNTGIFYASAFSAPIAGFTVFQVYSSALLVCLVLVVTRGVASASQRISRRAASAVVSLAAIALVLAAGINGLRKATAASDDSELRPNLILIGIDSLRLDEVRRFGGTGRLTPNIDRMLDASAVYTDTVTPIARTFPAWISILTGQYADKTGAKVNLIDRAEVQAAPTLADTLRIAGYKTVFATDEVRFSNIDEGYGFDQTITPKIGAADFLLGTFNDFPVSNVLAHTAIGGWLFPHTYANRAAYSRYQENTFTERLEAELDTGAPSFIAIHLTAAHWPYVWADSPEIPRSAEGPEADYLQYQQGLALVDRQLGGVLTLLEKKGLLANSIIVLLSDHGEALSRPNDRLIPKEVERILGASRPVEVGTFGHGSSVLSPVQFQVLLAMRGTGNAAELLPLPGEFDYPATLVDIAPTVLNALGIGLPREFDGIDLACDCAPTLENRIRFTETEFNLPILIAGQTNPALLASEGIDYYNVDSHSGWLELRAEKLPEIEARRERAALSRNYILAALPTLEGNSRFVLANRTTGDARLLLSAQQEDQEIQSLWHALQQKYGHFLGAPAS